jgi:hypothetical protein
MADSILQTFKVRDGRAIAKVWRSEISGLIGDNYRESNILIELAKIPLPNGLNDMRVGDYVTDVHLKRIIAKVDGDSKANAA